MNGPLPSNALSMCGCIGPCAARLAIGGRVCRTEVQRWRDDAFENAAKIAERWGSVDAARDIRAMVSTPAPSPDPADLLTKQRDHWRKQCRDLNDILRNIGECISGHDGHVFDDVHALLEQSQALKAPASPHEPSAVTDEHINTLLQALGLYAEQDADRAVVRRWLETSVAHNSSLSSGRGQEVCRFCSAATEPAQGRCCDMCFKLALENSKRAAQPPFAEQYWSYLDKYAVEHVSDASAFLTNLMCNYADRGDQRGEATAAMIGTAVDFLSMWVMVQRPTATKGESL